MSPIWAPAILWSAAPFVYLIRRWATGAALLASAASLAAAGVFIAVPPGLEASFLGRPLLFDPLRGSLLSAILVGMPVLFLFSSRVAEGWSFAPFALVSLGAIAAAALAESLLLAALLMEISGLVVVFLIQGGPERRTGAATGFLIAWTLALPPLALASWIADQVALQPDDAGMIRLGAALLALGMGLLLGAVPFHGYLAGMASSAPPTVTALFLTALQAVVLVVLVGQLETGPWLMAAGAGGILLVGGGVSVLGGGLLALMRPSPGRLLAYAAAADLGVILVGLGTLSAGGVSGALSHLFPRTLAIWSVAMAWSLMRHVAGTHDDLLPRGAARWAPWLAIAYLLGGLALAGVPPLGTFVTRWGIYGAVSEQAPGLAALLLAGSLAVAWAYAREVV
ncbi:MAG: proton-conducting transporter membrane subunit, partial [Anaerolineae bacterium]